MAWTVAVAHRLRQEMHSAKHLLAYVSDLLMQHSCRFTQVVVTGWVVLIILSARLVLLQSTYGIKYPVIWIDLIDRPLWRIDGLTAYCLLMYAYVQFMISWLLNYRWIEYDPWKHCSVKDMVFHNFCQFFLFVKVFWFPAVLSFFLFILGEQHQLGI